MAKEDIELRIKTALDSLDAQNGLGQLNKSLKTLKGLALEVGDSNEAAFRQITQAIGETKDRIGDLNAIIKSSSGEPIENLTNSFMGLKSSIMTLDFQSARRQFSQLQDSLTGLKDQLLGGEIFGKFNKAVESGAGGFKILKAAVADFGKALIATGIGAFIVAIGLLIAYYDDLKNAGGLLGDAMKALGKVISGISEAIYAIGVALGLVAEKESEASKQFILNKEREIEKLNDVNSALEYQLDLKVRLLAAAGKMTIDQEIQNNKDLINARQKTFTELNILGSRYLGKLNAYNRGQLALTDEELKDLNRKITENDKAIKDIEKQNQKALDDNKVLLVKKQKLESDANQKIIDDNKRKNQQKQQDDDAASKALAIFRNDALNDYEKEQMVLAELQKEYNKHFTQVDIDFLEIQKTNKFLTNQEIFRLLEEKYKKEIEVEEKTQKDLADLGIQDAEDKKKDRERFINEQEFRKKYKISDAEFEKAWQEEAAKNELLTYDEIMQKVIDRYELEREENKKTQKTLQDTKKIAFEVVLEVLKTASQIASSISSYNQQIAQNRMNDLKNQQSVEKENFEKNKEYQLERLDDEIKATKQGTKEREEAVKRKESYEKQLAKTKIQLDKKLQEEERRLAKESFEQGKRLSIVTTIINGAQAVVAALAGASSDTSGGILTAIRVAGVIATTAIQLATIKAQQFNAGPGGGAGGEGSVGGGLPPAPPIAVPSTMGLGEAQITPQKQKPMWQKVYVVESDIRNVTNRVEVIENRSVLGT